MTNGSCGRNNTQKKWRLEDLLDHIKDKELLIRWLLCEGLMAKTRLCSRCSAEMELVSCTDRSDGFKWNANYRWTAKDTRWKHLFGKAAGLDKAI